MRKNTTHPQTDSDDVTAEDMACGNPLAPSARWLPPQRVGERTLLRPETSRMKSVGANMVRPSSWRGCAFPERPLPSETASGRTMFAPTMWDSSWQTAPAPKFAPICAAYSTTPSRTFPSRAPPTQPITNPGPEQQPSTCKSAASRRVMRPAPYSCPASRAHTAYPPTQDSSSARAVSADSSPKIRCMGRNRTAGGGAAVSSSHTTKNGNSAGKTLCRQSAVPPAKPRAAASGTASTSTPNASAAAAASPCRFLPLFILRTSLRILD